MAGSWCGEHGDPSLLGLVDEDDMGKRGLPVLQKLLVFMSCLNPL